jgi:hypothetical protein
VPDTDQAKRIKDGLAIWHGALDIRDTPAETYLLKSRGLDVPANIGHALRFSGSLRLDRRSVCGMVALMRDEISNVPCGLHRTFLHPDGRPILERIPE